MSNILTDCPLVGNFQGQLIKQMIEIKSRSSKNPIRQ